MSKTVGIAKARTSLKEMLDEVQHKGEAFVISRNGKPAAVVVPLHVYEAWQRQRAEFFELVREMQRVSGRTSDEADSLAAQAVRAARRPK